MQLMQPFGRMRAWFECRIPARMIDIWRSYFDAVFPRIAHDLCRRVKTHRLRVQECGGKDVRITAFEPGRSVDQEREARRVAFRKAVFAEAFDLLETALREFALVTIGKHAVDHLALESADGADTLEGRHGTAQPVGLRWREAGGDNGDLHRLLLEQRHAQGLR